MEIEFFDYPDENGHSQGCDLTLSTCDIEEMDVFKRIATLINAYENEGAFTVRLAPVEFRSRYHGDVDIYLVINIQKGTGRF